MQRTTVKAAPAAAWEVAEASAGGANDPPTASADFMLYLAMTSR
jgi:hypothetical protein